MCALRARHLDTIENAEKLSTEVLHYTCVCQNITIINVCFCVHQRVFVCVFVCIDVLRVCNLF